jgi:hypothetical protein
MNETLVIIGLAAAVILAVVEEFRAQGQSLVGWSCIVGFGILLLNILLT